MSNTQHGRVVMASFNRERVEHALNELLVRIVPEDPDEDEDVANERYDIAYDHAYRELSGAGELPVVADISHVASQIDRRCENEFYLAER
ncbi:Microtubule-nucleating Tub4p (gamma-tubulin) complex component [Paraconiothyrium brasiliense]|uniref:Microtubule-nucleating Tub4p (Gamma-tubulin) complex component n=1 Tax=Paraconiothyrium brasiliense TaxID=300254 RepID=A0ABR3S2B6_9PLEO